MIHSETTHLRGSCNSISFCVEGLGSLFLFYCFLSQCCLSTTETKFLFPILFAQYYSFKHAGNHDILYFCQIVMESPVFSCWNPFLGTKLCPGHHWLYTHRRHHRFSHIFTWFVWVYFFILLHGLRVIQPVAPQGCFACVKMAANFGLNQPTSNSWKSSFHLPYVKESWQYLQVRFKLYYFA